MPCDRITTSEIDLKNANSEVMQATLRALGMIIKTEDNGNIVIGKNYLTMVTWTKGQGTSIRSNISNMGEKITNEYSKTALKTASKKYGWNWKQTAENIFNVTRN